MMGKYKLTSSHSAPIQHPIYDNTTLPKTLLQRDAKYEGNKRV
jgi:hypothetical protein